jgi:hypothetical protein
MTLKIKTADIELEYTDEYSIIEGQAKQYILDIINKIHEHQVIHSKSLPLPKVSAYDVFDALNK